MTKIDLRAALRAERLRFVAALGATRAARETSVCERLDEWLDRTASVAFYRGVESEVDVAAALAVAARRGCDTALPFLIDASGSMEFRRWRPGDPLVRGPLGIEGPAAEAPTLNPDAIVAPLLGFTRRGGRLGQGGGFYDRAFARFPRARRIGAGWSMQEVDTLPLDPWDVPLHAIVTEREVIEVSR